MDHERIVFYALNINKITKFVINKKNKIKLRQYRQEMVTKWKLV